MIRRGIIRCFEEPDLVLEGWGKFAAGGGSPTNGETIYFAPLARQNRIGSSGWTSG
jgi:hypothetical protein